MKKGVGLSWQLWASRLDDAERLGCEKRGEMCEAREEIKTWERE